MKLVLISKRPYEIEGDNGKVYRGFSYAGYAEGDEIVEFTSEKDREIRKEALGYDKRIAEEIELGIKVFGGKVKRQEVKA